MLPAYNLFPKRVLKICVICHKLKTDTELMGSLSLDRMPITPLFSKVGIDFGGPFTIHGSNNSRKSYIDHIFLTYKYISKEQCAETVLQSSLTVHHCIKLEDIYNLREI